MNHTPETLPGTTMNGRYIYDGNKRKFVYHAAGYDVCDELDDLMRAIDQLERKDHLLEKWFRRLNYARVFTGVFVLFLLISQIYFVARAMALNNFTMWTGFNCFLIGINAGNLWFLLWKNRRKPPQPSTTCPRCFRTSYNWGDIEHRFCSMCGYYDDLLDHPLLGPRGREGSEGEISHGH